MTTMQHAPNQQAAADRAAIRTLAALRGIGFGGAGTGLVLLSRDIGTTYGFNRGRVPDILNQTLEDWYDRPRRLLPEHWHVVLWELVHDYLLPTLSDGIPNVTLWAGHHANPIHSFDRIAFEMVRVPWVEVFTYTVHLLDRIDHQHPNHRRDLPR